LRLAKQRDDLSVVNDQFGAPTWSRMIAQATALLVARGMPGEQGNGICNLTAGGQTSWYGFARAILELVPADAERRLEPKSRQAAATGGCPVNCLADAVDRGVATKLWRGSGVRRAVST